jgi:hypothetical protein
MSIATIPRRGRKTRISATLALMFAAGLVLTTPVRAESEAVNGPGVEDRLALLESEVARLKQQQFVLRSSQDDTAEELSHIRAALANATIGLESLRSSIEEHNQGRLTADAALDRRVDRLERMITSDSTGSIGNPQARRRLPPVLTGWSVRGLDGGKAAIAGRGTTYWVTPGSYVPGLGRINNVRQRGNSLVVVTSRGTIVQR